jgi:hypothetical protein
VTPPGEHLLYLRQGTLYATDGFEAAGVDRPGVPVVKELAGNAPDGRWLAHSSDESGRCELYVRTIPDPVENGKSLPQAKKDLGDFFDLTPDGKRIVVRQLEGSEQAAPRT